MAASGAESGRSMKPVTPSVASEIERFLQSGDTDPHHAAWSGRSFMERAGMAHQDLTDALVAQVKERSRAWTPPAALRDLDVAAFTRRKVAPMVRGLFPRAEQDIVLALVERSVVFLTPRNIEHVLRCEAHWPRSAWDIANLYLGSIGAELLCADAPRIVGLS